MYHQQISTHIHISHILYVIWCNSRRRIVCMYMYMICDWQRNIIQIEAVINRLTFLETFNHIQLRDR